MGVRMDVSIFRSLSGEGLGKGTWKQKREIDL